MKKRLLAFAIAGLAVASAKTYNVTLFQPSTLGGTDLKAGEYKLDVQGDKAVLKAGKVAAEAPAKVETNGTRYASTTVRMSNVDGKMKIQEIRIGGTNTKVVFDN